MGLYATATSWDDLIPNYYAGGSSTADARGLAIVSKMIDKAEAQVNGCVVSRYDPTAFTATSASGPNVPPLLRTLTEDIASTSRRSSCVQ